MSSSVLKNASVLTVSNVLSPIASMVLVLAIGRLRGAEELGAYSLAMSVFVFFESLAALGLPVIVTREVAKQPAEAARHFAAGCAVGLGIVTAVLAVFVPAVLFLGKGAPVAAAMAVLALTVLPSVVTAFGTAVLLALEHVTDFVCIDLAERIGRTALGSAIVFMGFGIVAVAWIVLLLRLVASAAYVVRLNRRNVPIMLTLDRGVCRSLLRDVPVVGMIPVVNAIYARIDIFILSMLTSLGNVGQYGAALRLLDIARTFPSAMGRALYPQLSRLASGSPSLMLGNLQRSTRHLLMITGAGVLLLAGLAQGIIEVLYGSAFAPAGSCLRLLVWAVLPYALACILSTGLFATGHQAADLRVNLICTAICPLLHLALIPRLGIQGAALATCLVMTLYGTLQYFYLKSLVIAPKLGGFLLRLGVALCAAFATTRLFGSGHELARTVTSLAIYALALAASGILTKVDRSEILRVISAAHARLNMRRAA